MKKSINQDGVLPSLMGTEHELSIAFNKRISINPYSLDDLEIDIHRDPTSLIDDFNSINSDSFFNEVSRGVLTTSESYAPLIKLLENGGVLYAISGRPLEIATPECLSPKQLVTYSIASRLLIKKWLADYLQENSNDIRSIAINERVVDSHGNSWGEHDNYSLLPEESGYGVVVSCTPPLIWAHLLTRGTITGSGMVPNTGSRPWSMSQKIGTVSSIYDKKWGSSAMFGYDERLEIRCSDKNVSEWSHLIRVGSMALVLALTRTGFTLDDIGIDFEQYDQNKILAYDNLHVSSKGDVRLTYDSKISVSVQRILAEASLEMLDDYDQTASEYKMIAQKWLAFAEKLEKAANSDAPIDLSQFLETDWASKFYTIQNKIKADIDSGSHRDPLDIKSRAQDILYDRLLLDTPMAGSKVYESEGLGFKLNNRIPSRKIVNIKDINQSLDTAPQYSRADSRVKFLKVLKEIGCVINSFDWQRISWEDPDGEIHERFF